MNFQNIQGVPKKPEKPWNVLLIKIECPSTKLNAKCVKY